MNKNLLVDKLMELLRKANAHDSHITIEMDPDEEITIMYEICRGEGSGRWPIGHGRTLGDAILEALEHYKG